MSRFGPKAPIPGARQQAYAVVAGVGRRGRLPVAGEVAIADAAGPAPVAKSVLTPNASLPWFSGTETELSSTFEVTIFRRAVTVQVAESDR